MFGPAPESGGHPSSKGLCEAGCAPDHCAMDKTLQTQKKERAPSDFLGAFGFVVLITTVVYAALTAV
jgi:hypothetical protein